MKEGKGVWLVFALPIVTVAVIFGALVGFAFHIPILISFVGVIVALALLHIRVTLVYIILFGFLLGALRATIPISPFDFGENPLLKIRRDADKILSLYIEEPSRALVSGIVFGGTSQFTEEWKRIFKSTGTSHIVAVSGANVVFVVQWVGFLISRLRLSRKNTAILNGVFILGYILITGAPASVVRAGIMVLLAEYGLLRGRYVSGIHVLAGAALIMILLDPKNVQDIGFQFSCLATLGLITVTGKAHADSISENIQATISASLFVLPLQLWYFSSFSFIALFANTIIVPFIPLIMIGGIIVIGISFVSSVIAGFGGTLVGAIALCALLFLKWCASITGAVGEIPISVVTLIVLYMIIFCAVLFVSYKKIRF